MPGDPDRSLSSVPGVSLHSQEACLPGDAPGGRQIHPRLLQVSDRRVPDIARDEQLNARLGGAILHDPHEQPLALLLAADGW